MSFATQLGNASKPVVLASAAAAVCGLAGLFTAMQHYATQDQVPRTVTPLWQEANQAYRKYQKQDPILDATPAAQK
eukprot:CAMPEP_0118920080 /NCGR_PEP_ID=MMETSP1166-20130328/18888_1 /TAXON_ID=1104430 /ORGANISM="Chrysoreinhardia sp, Strain CCMP3193" /LENGTH=75 /DNA_ID=CAMNT_0006860617 /DNA_START=641 /DNA_END=868 /DNA_ORIENTATION=-